MPLQLFRHRVHRYSQQCILPDGFGHVKYLVFVDGEAVDSSARHRVTAPNVEYREVFLFDNDFKRAIEILQTAGACCFHRNIEVALNQDAAVGADQFDMSVNRNS